MSTIKIYTGIGIFDSDNDLIAQGAQQLKFEGFCTVTKIADQTVVDIGLGNIDGGVPSSNYGGANPINAGGP